jgi:endonuclease/exonuclease/phosphatase family metal-dependent hydrolase
LTSRNVPLPHSPENEPRAALEITTVTPWGDTISFIGTHLDHLRNEVDRVAQVKKINEVFSKNKYPTILAGDLNDIPGSTAIDILETIWSPSYDQKNIRPTYSSENPIKKIDYVMFYPSNRWRVISREEICDKVASDHCAYLVVLELVK